MPLFEPVTLKLIIEVKIVPASSTVLYTRTYVLPVCFIFDLFPNFGKVHKLFSLGVKKLAIFVRTVDQLENQWSPGHNATASRKEISAMMSETC